MTSFEYFRKFYKCNKYLPDDETKVLITKYRNGEGVLNDLISGHLKIVLRECSILSSKFHYHPDDIINYGIDGLLYAINHFDLNANYQFYAYAKPCIRFFLMRYKNYEPRTDYLEELLNYDDSDDNDNTLDRLNCIKYEHNYDDYYFYGVIDRALKLMSDKEQRIMKYKFFEDKSNAEIGGIEGVSRESIRKILESCINRLKRNTEVRKIKGWKPFKK